MAPWSIQTTPEYKAYDKLTKVQSWWPAFSKENGDHVVATGEVWCRVREGDGTFCSSGKFTSTPNLRKHVEQHHGGCAKSAGGVVSVSQRPRLVAFYRSLVVQPVSQNISTFGTPKKTTKHTMVAVTPVRAPVFVSPGVGSVGAAPRPPMPRDDALARARAGFPNGCSQCGTGDDTVCPDRNDSHCEVMKWYGLRVGDSDEEDEDEDEDEE